VNRVNYIDILNEDAKKKFSKVNHKVIKEMWAWNPESYGVAFNYWRLYLLRKIIFKNFNSTIEILDLGSAESIFTWDIILLNHIIKNKSQIIACEASIVPIRHAKKFAKKYIDYGAIKFINCSVTHLPLKTRKYDIIFAGQILNHLIDPPKCLKMWKIYLNKKGLLIIDVTNERLFVLKKIIAKYLFKRPSDHLHYYFFNNRKLKKILKNHFSYIKIIGLGQLFGFPMMFIDKILKYKKLLMYITRKSNPIISASLFSISKI